MTREGRSELPARAPSFDEWCLHCGSDTCEHVARHNAAYGSEPHAFHVSRLTGTVWCDTCDSPYCELA